MGEFVCWLARNMEAKFEPLDKKMTSIEIKFFRKNSRKTTEEILV